MQGFEARLGRIQTKRDIMHRQQSELNFPRLKETLFDTEKLPSKEEIQNVVKEAQQSALELALNLGFEAADISFDESIILKKPKLKPNQDCGKFEFVYVPEELACHGQAETIPEATKFFNNVAETLNLEDSRNYRNVFKMRNKNNKLVHVKKSTFVWMFTSGLQKCSTDRIYRFQDFETKSSVLDLLHSNAVLETITVGEYVLLKDKCQLYVCRVYGFQYLKGKNCSCPLATVPVRAPDNIQQRGIGLLGSFFSITMCDDDYNLDLKSSSGSIDIERYLSHLEKPSVSYAILHYTGETASYIRKFLNQIQNGT